MPSPPPCAEHATTDSLAWLNALLKKLWPRIDKAVQRVAHDALTPLIQAHMPHSLRAIHFMDFTLGEHTPPILGPLTVKDTEFGVKLQVRFDYRADNDINVGLMGASIGIRNLVIASDLVIRFEQFLDEAPVVGGLVFYLLDPPRIDFGFSGIAKIAQFVPGVGPAIRHALLRAIGDLLVLPNQLCVVLGTEAQGVDEALLKLAMPSGLLRVFPKEGRALQVASIVGLRGAQAPYVSVQSAGEAWKSHAATLGRDPTWPENDCGDFFVYDEQQRLLLTVIDDDSQSGGEVIGQLQSMTISQALNARGALRLIPNGFQQDSGAVFLETKPPRSCAFVVKDVLSRLLLWTESYLGDVDVGSITLDCKFLVMCQGELCGDKMVLKVKVDEAILPRGSGQEVKLRATIQERHGGDVHVVAAKTTPPGRVCSAETDGSHERSALEDVIRRLAKRHMPHEDIAEVTSLTRDAVAAVVNGGNLEQTHLQGKPQVIEVEATVWLVFSADALSKYEVELALANRADKLIARRSIPLARVASAPRLELPGPLQFGQGIEADVGLTLFGTKVSDDVAGTGSLFASAGAELSHGSAFT